jgi:hypothetical protein
LRVNRLLVILVLAAVAVALPVASAGSAPKQGKDYTAVVPSALAGDTVDYTMTVTNLTGTQQFGSANVTIPAAIGLGVDGGLSVAPRGTALRSATNPRVIELRDLALAPNESATLTLGGLEMPCVGPAPQWELVAKQSNDFSGLPGNALNLRTEGSDVTTDLVGQCRLNFLARPRGAQKTLPIRSVPFEPDGPPVRIDARDPQGDPVPSFTTPVALGLAGTGTGSLSQDPADPAAAGGVLSYSGLRISAAGSYNLTATKTGYIAATSEQFQIVDVAQDCDDESCEATLDGRRTSNRVNGELIAGDPGHALLSSNVGTRPDCEFAGHTSRMGPDEWYEFEVTVDRRKTVTVTFSRLAMKAASGGASSLEICFSSPEPFTANGGLRQFNYVDDDGDPLDGFVGLLPDCPEVPTDDPCILDREPAGGGTAVVTFFAPASLGDPRYRG